MKGSDHFGVGTYVTGCFLDVFREYVNATLSFNLTFPSTQYIFHSHQNYNTTEKSKKN